MLGGKNWSTDGTCGHAHGPRKCAGIWGHCCDLDGRCGTGEDFYGMGRFRSGDCVEFDLPASSLPLPSVVPEAMASDPASTSTEPVLVPDGGTHDEL